MSDTEPTQKDNTSEIPDLEKNAPVASPKKRLRLNIPNQFEITPGFAEKIVAEFWGTALFLLIAYLNADVANLIEENASSAKTILIAIGFGFGLAIAIGCTATISGGHHNPAVSTAAWLIGMVAGGVASALTPGPVLFANAKIGIVSISRALFIEAAGTLILIVTVIAAALRPRFSISSPPTVIGLSLFLGHLICVPTTGAGLNPARSFGAALAAREFVGYHWIYWVGPLLASICVAFFYNLYYVIFDYEE